MQKGKTPEGKILKGIMQTGITQRGKTQTGITPRGIAQRGITQRGITQRGITQAQTQASPREVLGQYLRRALIELLRQEDNGVNNDYVSFHLEQLIDVLLRAEIVYEKSTAGFHTSKGLGDYRSLPT